ncbi:hypothetical protein ACQP1P_38450 [Dactylosporangium sp. CA-052675]|uniref:hypothetical protein n=1 Tax=Dactylosporangium sp. CA-052675 TaxID=3239927 RepID=UPI003D8ED54C
MDPDLSALAAEYRAAWQAVDDLKRQLVDAKQRVRDARADLTDGLVAKAQAGVRMGELVELTGLSREWIRQLLRANGVESDR